MNPPEWKTMESAPRDGTLLLVTDVEGDMPLVGSWCADRKQWVCARNDDAFYPQPTHWHPLPSPPSDGEGQ